MVLPGHIAGGYIVTRILLAATPVASAVSPTELTILTILGTVAGDFPDIDLLTKKADHRTNPTHVPLFWILVCVIVFFLGWLSGSAFIMYGALFICGGALSHLTLDSIEYGVSWLWPLTTKRYALHESRVENKITARPGSWLAHWQFVRHMYFKTWVFWAELVVTIIAISIFLAS